MLRSLIVIVAVALLAPTALTQRRPSAAPASAAAALQAFDAVRNEPESERVAAARALGRFEDAAVTALLLEELEAARDARYRAALVGALGAVSREGVLDVLARIAEADDSDASLRSAAARGLAVQGDAGVTRLAALAARSGNDAVSRGIRTQALAGLGQAKTPAAWEQLASIAKHGDLADRRTALRYLDDAPDVPAVTEARLTGLTDGDFATACTCLRQLADTEHAAARDAVLELCDKVDDQRTTLGRADLLQAVVKLLEPRLFEAFLTQAASSDAATRRILDEALPEVATNGEFVDWLRTNLSRRKSPAERCIAVRVLGHVPGPEVTLELAALVRAREPEVVVTALRTLAARGDHAALPELRKLLRVRDDERRVEVLHAIHALLGDDPEWLGELLDVLKDATGRRDVGARVAAIDLLGEIGTIEALPLVWKHLDDKEWTVRAACYDFCRKVRDIESVPKLIGRLDEESGRLREDVLDALQAHTAMRFSATARWNQWWKSSRDGFALVPAEAFEQQRRRRRPAAEGGTTTYYGIPLISERVVFVVDVSGSMAAQVGTGGRTRLDEAKRQLKRVVEATPKHFQFDIVPFQSTESAVFGALSPATEQARTTALAQIEALVPRGGTNVHAALQRAFASDGVDTIYLLSDGSPSAGEITDPDELADEVARWNRTRQVRIHCISIGADSAMLKRIAEDSGGEYATSR